MVNCQYGCEEVKDDVRCLCPSSGLQLAPNGKTCIGMLVVLMILLFQTFLKIWHVLHIKMEEIATLILK